MPLLAAAALAAAALASLPAASSQEPPAAPAALEEAGIGLSVAAALLGEGDEAGAAHAAEFASRQFIAGMSGLPPPGQGGAPAAEIHVALLDVPPSIPGTDAAARIAAAASMVGGYGAAPAGGPRQAVVMMLNAADEQYALASEGGGESEAAHRIAAALFSRSKAVFEADADPGSMLDVEQISFLDSIESTAAARGDFSRVGSLVSAVQRDLLGTETLLHDSAGLYENIRALYGRLLVAVDAGDYAEAEDLAIEAYLENFEYLEPELEAADAEHMHRLEVQMREDLRSMVREGGDPAEIRAFLEGTILPSLDEGEAKVAALASAYPEALASPSFGGVRKGAGETTEDERSGVRGEIDSIRASLGEMLAHYEAGDVQSAYATARTAYLDSYEYVEIPLRPIDPDFTLEVEYLFADLRNLIKREAPYGEVREAATRIERNLDESERLVTGTGQLAPAIAFSASFAIIFREGLESVLILGAILTYLEASRNSRFKPYVYYGVLAAVGATAATWFAASYVVEISGASRELIEAVAALSATAVLFYVSFWILNKIEHKKWMEFVKAKVWQATTTGSVMVFVMLAFFTVYREGFETVLFYQAMLGFAKYMEAYVGLGFVAGMASLLLLYYVMRRLGRRLPLRVLFGLTMGIGAYLSIAFLGNAVRELQVLDIVPYTSMIGTVPRLDINMATMTGIYPTLETVVAQAVLCGVYVAASTYVLVLRPRKERMVAGMRKSRGGAGGA